MAKISMVNENGEQFHSGQPLILERQQMCCMLVSGLQHFAMSFYFFFICHNDAHSSPVIRSLYSSLVCFLSSGVPPVSV